MKRNLRKYLTCFAHQYKTETKYTDFKKSKLVEDRIGMQKEKKIEFYYLNTYIFYRLILSHCH